MRYRMPSLCGHFHATSPWLRPTSTRYRAEVDSAAASGVRLIALSRLKAPPGSGGALQIISLGGDIHVFDSVYPVMGCHPRTDVLRLDVERDEDGMVRTDKHQRTSIEHLYAAGDIVNTLNQISVASGEAAIAATAIHKSLPHNAH